MCHAVIWNERQKIPGRIINISSINGQKGQMGQCNYSAAKAGMLIYRALAQKVPPKVLRLMQFAWMIVTDMTSAMPQEVLDSIVRQIPAARMGKPKKLPIYGGLWPLIGRLLLI